MSAIVRLLNVNAKEFDEFYQHVDVSSHRMSRDQMLLIADLFHEKIRERRGKEAPLDGAQPRALGRRQSPSA